MGGPASARIATTTIDWMGNSMSKKSKAYRAAAEKVDRTRVYSPLEAAKWPRKPRRRIRTRPSR
ncbi:50S ribosomal L1 domain protein [Mycobacterium xenopi 3993]|nr:50S ribosomal L1 domain protein [Mycobacterium xenopi 3993]